MGTRTYCDLCGMTISGVKPTKFCFGNFDVIDAYYRHQYGYVDPSHQQQQAIHAAMQAQNHSSGAIAGSYGITAGMNAAPPKPEVVELCFTCTKIWWEKVTKITRGSDPDVPTK